MRGGRTLALLVGAALTAVAATRPAGDSDVYWHLATAREALAHGIVREDVFSWTIRGMPVSTDQWLGQLAFYGAYLAEGWAGVVLLRAFLVGAVVGLAVLNAALAARRSGPLVALLAALPAIFLIQFVSSERPLLFGFLSFAALLVLLRLARDGSDLALALVVPLLAVWANLHGSFALGAGLVLLAGVEAGWREPARRTRYAVAATVAIAVTLLTPAGIGSWTAPGFHLLSPPREIQEWALPDPRTPMGLIFAATGAIALAIAIVTRSLPLREAVILLPVAVLACTAVRHTPLFAIAIAPYLASHGPRALAPLIRRVRSANATPVGATPVRLARAFDRVCVALAAALAIAAIVAAPHDPDESAFPVAALAVLPAGPGLFNHYDWGGWLIWHAPSTPVFIDGRYTPYRCCGALDDFRTVISAQPGWSEVLTRRGVRAILVRPQDQVAARGIEMGWTVLARAPGFVLLRVP